MAGAIVKQEVIGSSEVKVLMREMNWSHREALGCLALLWSGSQNRKFSRASADLIGEWCECASPAETQKLVETLSLEKCGFLKRKSLDRFEICGNVKEIRALKSLKTAQKNGGAKTRAKWVKQSKRAQDAELRSLVSSVVPTQPNPTQPNLPNLTQPAGKTKASDAHASLGAGAGDGDGDGDEDTIAAAIEAAQAEGKPEVVASLTAWRDSINAQKRSLTPKESRPNV